MVISIEPRILPFSSMAWIELMIASNNGSKQLGGVSFVLLTRPRKSMSIETAPARHDRRRMPDG